MLVRLLSSLYFTQLGVREVYLGLLNLLGLPWNIKFIWAPLIDGWGSKKAWQVVMQLVLGLLTLLIAYLSYRVGTSSDHQPYLAWIAFVFMVMAFFAATNDVAIDGYYLEAIPSREQQALFSGYRVLAYRLSMVFARSGLVGLVAWATARFAGGSPALGWVPAFLATGLVLLVLAIFHFCSLPALGDEVLCSRVTPFWVRELKVTTEQYAWVAGIVGAAGTIVGAIAGGYWIKQVGLRRALWPLTILMNVTIWLYVWLSVVRPDPSTLSGIAQIAVVHGVEQIAAGLGSAALLVFLLSTCSQAYRATHYAVGSAIMTIPGTVIGSFGGALVETIGYTNLYILAFIAAIPSMFLIPLVPVREE